MTESIVLVKEKLIRDIGAAEVELDKAWERRRKEVEYSWSNGSPIIPDDGKVREAFMKVVGLKRDLADWILEHSL